MFSAQKVAATNTTAELRKREPMHHSWDHLADLMDENPGNSSGHMPFKPAFHQD